VTQAITKIKPTRITIESRRNNSVENPRTQWKKLKLTREGKGEAESSHGAV
jgi:hypothetical protein